jgi:arylsulfatase
LNGIFSLEDVLPTLLAAAGEPNIKEKLLKGKDAGAKHFHVHLDGYNQLPYLEGSAEDSLRHEFFYYGEKSLYALRYNNWKVHFATKDDWFGGELKEPTVPQPVNLRADPFEQHMQSPNYPSYAIEKLWTVVPSAALLMNHAKTFEDFPPRQTPAMFDPEAVANKIIAMAANRQGN